MAGPSRGRVSWNAARRERFHVRTVDNAGAILKLLA